MIEAGFVKLQWASMSDLDVWLHVALVFVVVNKGSPFLVCPWLIPYVRNSVVQASLAATSLRYSPAPMTVLLDRVVLMIMPQQAILLGLACLVVKGDTSMG
jgi:hypothetical protein